MIPSSFVAIIGILFAPGSLIPVLFAFPICKSCGHILIAIMKLFPAASLPAMAAPASSPTTTIFLPDITLASLATSPRIMTFPLISRVCFLPMSPRKIYGLSLSLLPVVVHDSHHPGHRNLYIDLCQV